MRQWRKLDMRQRDNIKKKNYNKKLIRIDIWKMLKVFPVGFPDVLLILRKT
jgi:hypothetical protein